MEEDIPFLPVREVGFKRLWLFSGGGSRPQQSDALHFFYPATTWGCKEWISGWQSSCTRLPGQVPPESPFLLPSPPSPTCHPSLTPACTVCGHHTGSGRGKGEEGGREKPFLYLSSPVLSSSHLWASTPCKQRQKRWKNRWDLHPPPQSLHPGGGGMGRFLSFQETPPPQTDERAEAWQEERAPWGRRALK